MPASNLAREFRSALRPLIRRFNKERTVSLGKSGILGRLNEQGPATASELAASERITPQAVAVALRELEELSYVARSRDEADRRRVHVQITEQGRVALNSEHEAGTRWLADALRERLDDTERATLSSVVPVLRKLMREAADE
ncbi:MAG: MarR family transcriptional regulator [Brevibacterium sp.]|uniref:MarR family winged helix-turn-helix transcriptional regulator n=1 Tax=Brevibacterium sp. TaxID=1701 RepID=UPI00264798A7|nr:MarR family transcriptional regulator [Brevibacterium sp.]MDN5806916.1 MarR family transcriptional regulator [Brevibacterium sp.]MDN5833288.1 MarR family transcriptional regulator [Brevibacterium sp.]MDN5877816.1 MarR family transcriptional regulator [Brevibacterium sp.]MDN5910606.1 MarR family transcriptional regulator [Brevibacterium sp.]MDN6124020.1 MarR family transcriptional regulator [Brevibacterium sp.]